jgi:hypothetical protein
MGLAQPSSAPRVGHSEMHHPRPTAPPGLHHRDTSGRAARCALRIALAEWGNDRSGWRAARCSSHLPDQARAPPVGEQRDHPVVTTGIEGRDHKLIAQAPTSDGLVVNRRAPASGTAARATTEFGSSANPTGPLRKGSARPRGPPRMAGTDPRLHPGQGCRDGAPSQGFHDQVDTMGLSAPTAAAVDAGAHASARPGP